MVWFITIIGLIQNLVIIVSKFIVLISCIGRELVDDFLVLANNVLQFTWLLIGNIDVILEIVQVEILVSVQYVVAKLLRLHFGALVQIY